MAAIPNRPLSQNKYSEQNMQNTSFDEDFGVNTFESLGFDGTSLQRMNADAVAMKMTTVGSVTYLAIAAPGTAQSSAKWQCLKMDETSGLIVTYADGDADYNNVATDLTSLVYQ